MENFFSKIAHDRDYKYNQHCRGRQFHDFTSFYGCVWKNNFTTFIIFLLYINEHNKRCSIF